MSVEAGSGGGADLGGIRAGMTVLDRDGEPLGQVLRVHVSEADASPPAPDVDDLPAPEPVGPPQPPVREPVPAQPGAGGPRLEQRTEGDEARTDVGHIQIDGPVGAVYAAAAQVERVSDDVVHLAVSRAELRDYLFPSEG